VFTVNFVTDFSGTATINFGKVSEGFTLAAPVGAGETSALLLGMVHSKDYQYQVVVDSGTEQCVSETMTLTTGGFPGGSGLADASIQPGSSSSPVEPGFIVSSPGVGQGNYAYIINHEGEMVWWYEVPLSEISAARMSWDGKFMYARELNVGRSPNGRVMKVGMDGMGEEVVNLATSHHDFAPTPDGGFLYIAGYGNNSCDGIFKYPSEELLFDVDSAFSWTGVGAIGAENCHTNAIQYNEFDNSVTFSDTNHDAIVSVDYDTGALNWIYGGAQDSTFTGDVTWDREHGHHMLDADTMYMFSNGAFSGGASNIYRVRFSGTTATWDWHYNVQGLNSSTLGDVQGLPGGNVLVTYSSAGGILHEVDENEQLVRSISMPFTNSGYANHRPTLYGKPSR
jgi:hypothetical protein